MAALSAKVHQHDLANFRAHLAKSKRIVALLGAGLSASSGLPTFRGAGGLWRTHDATSIATPEAFAADPSFVWQFYSYRRHMAIQAHPNRAHLALAELSRRKPDFITLSQNVDGLSPRANHPAAQLKLLHGSLFDVKCWDQERCGYVEENNFDDPIVPALAIPQARVEAENELQSGRHDRADTSTRPDRPHSEAQRGPEGPMRDLDISNIDIPLPSIQTSELPQCPRCQQHLLRPGVVWFGEALPEQTMSEVDAYFSDKEGIDLMLVIGTSAQVYPAAGYTQFARAKGARVAIVNMDPSARGDLKLDPQDARRDWFFQDDAAVVLPEMFRDVIGETPAFADAVAQAKV